MNDSVPESSYVISLRITHPCLPADQLSAMMDVEPRFSGSVGDERKSGGKLLGGRHKSSFIVAPVFPKTTGDVMEGISNVIQRFSDKAAALNDIVETGGRAELFVGVFAMENWGFVMGLEDMARLSAMKLEVSFDAYFGDD